MRNVKLVRRLCGDPAYHTKSSRQHRGKRSAFMGSPRKIYNISLNVNLAKYKGAKSHYFAQKPSLSLPILESLTAYAYA